MDFEGCEIELYEAAIIRGNPGAITSALEILEAEGWIPHHQGCAVGSFGVQGCWLTVLRPGSAGPLKPVPDTRRDQERLAMDFEGCDVVYEEQFQITGPLEAVQKAADRLRAEGWSSFGARACFPPDGRYWAVMIRRGPGTSPPAPASAPPPARSAPGSSA